MLFTAPALYRGHLVNGLPRNKVRVPDDVADLAIGDNFAACTVFSISRLPILGRTRNYHSTHSFRRSSSTRHTGRSSMSCCRRASCLMLPRRCLLWSLHGGCFSH
eukprot:857680-Pleurochrysis_carterae.AAC.1